MEESKMGVDLFIKITIIFILYKSKPLHNLIAITLDYLNLLTI
jgi:hypothetical protein